MPVEVSTGALKLRICPPVVSPFISGALSQRPQKYSLMYPTVTFNQFLSLKSETQRDRVRGKQHKLLTNFLHQNSLPVDHCPLNSSTSIILAQHALLSLQARPTSMSQRQKEPRGGVPD